MVLRGTAVTLDDVASPTFVGIRQRDFCGTLRVRVTLLGDECGEAGVTAYMCEDEHYEIALRRTESGFEVIERLNIGGIKHVQAVRKAPAGDAVLRLGMNNYAYTFALETPDGVTELGAGAAKYLTSEVSGGFTGVVLGLYAVGVQAQFTQFAYDLAE